MFTCTSCAKSFTDRLEYINHIRYVHPDMLSLACGFQSCSRSFKSFESFRKHVRSKHDSLANAKKRKLEGNPMCHTSSVHTTLNDDLSKPTFVAFDDHTSSYQALESDGLINNDSSNEKHVESTETGSIDSIICLAAELHKHYDIPRVRTSEIINIAENFMNNLLSKVQVTVSNALNNSAEKEFVLKNIEEIHGDYSRSFDKINTEHKCLETFKAKGTLILPISYPLGKKKVSSRRKGIKIPRMVSITAQFIPMRHVLKFFFEMPGVLHETMDYIELAENSSGILFNFIQGDLWKNLSANDGDKLYLPLFISFDDYETNNPLGSHGGAAKCGAVYLSIPCLPPNYQSKLENIFLFILFNSLDRKLFQNKIIFAKLIKELEFLQTSGITISQPTGDIQLYFRLSLLIADNLGMHEILGFGENFNQRKFCRFCLTDRCDIDKVFVEEKCILRDERNYERDLKANDQKQTGIKKNCVLTGVGGFHPVLNITVDIVHDGLEGFCRYDLGVILNHFISKKKYFSLQDLNNRIDNLDYGTLKNKPAKITIYQLKKKFVIMSASEMLALVRHLSLIIGDLIPEDDDTWGLYLAMKDIIEITMTRSMHPDTHQVLGTCIAEYLTELNRLFPGSLKPKHHFLIHYPRVLRACGPISKLTTIRFEGKHREGKITSRAAVSRVNVSKTIALKHQLKLNHSFLNKNVSQHFQYNKKSVKRCPLSQLTGMVDVGNYFLNKLGSCDLEISTVKKMLFEGMHIEIGSIIMIPGENRPCLYEVQHIILNDEEKFLVIVKLFCDAFLDEHTQHYEIISPECVYQVLKCSDLYGSIITHLVDLPQIGQFIVKSWF